MKNIIVIATTFLTSACYLNTPFELDTMTPVPVRESYISLRDNSGIFTKIGSAVIIEDGYAITSRHVIEGSNGMKGYMAAGIEFPVTEVILSERLDLALFVIPCGVGKSVKTGERVRIGERVFGAGTSNGAALYEGVVRKIDLAIHHVDVDLHNPIGMDTKGRVITQGFLCEGNFKKGFSGGPIVNSRGELVGIIQGYTTELLSDINEPELNPSKTYGTAYHITDILDEVKRMTYQKRNRCISTDD